MSRSGLVGVSTWIAWFLSVAVFDLAGPSTVRAHLLIDTSPAAGGVDRTGEIFGPAPNGVTFSPPIQLDSPVTFFAQSFSSMLVSPNGVISFGQPSFYDANFGINGGNGSPFAAIFWDDFHSSDVDPPTRVEILDDVAGVFALSVKNTRRGSWYFSPVDVLSYQVAFFRDAMSIGGFNFESGDIAFSYADRQLVGGAEYFTVGINDGVGKWATVPGSFNGMFDYGNLMISDLLPFDHRVLLFRPDGSAGYMSSIEWVPEPHATLLVLASMASLYRRTKVKSD